MQVRARSGKTKTGSIRRRAYGCLDISFISFEFPSHAQNQMVSAVLAEGDWSLQFFSFLQLSISTASPEATRLQASLDVVKVDTSRGW